MTTAARYVESPGAGRAGFVPAMGRVTLSRAVERSQSGEMARRMYCSGMMRELGLRLAVGAARARVRLVRAAARTVVVFMVSEDVMLVCLRVCLRCA